MERYRAKHFDLSGLAGISDRTLEMHFKLYEGYVQQTNTLQARIATFLEDGHVDQEEMPDYSELKRRLGFEYNGMVLHEYYFANLKQHGGGDPARGAEFRRAAEDSFGRSASRTRGPDGCRTTGSRSTRSATSRASSRSS